MAEDEPLFPDVGFNEDRRHKGGLLSLFGGRRRYETPQPELRDPRAAPIPQARSTSSAAPAPEEKTDDAEDLEIPSFLRRLAN